VLSCGTQTKTHKYFLHNQTMKVLSLSTAILSAFVASKARASSLSTNAADNDYSTFTLIESLGAVVKELKIEPKCSEYTTVPRIRIIHFPYSVF
jgi:hypothetical protein